MGVIVNKNNLENSELSRKIAADLRDKATTSNLTDDKDPDFSEDVEYLKNSKKTGKFGWVWVVLVILAIISLISIVFI